VKGCGDVGASPYPPKCGVWIGHPDTRLALRESWFSAAWYPSSTYLRRISLRLRAFRALLLSILICPIAAVGSGKTYKHASEYQVAVLDQTVRVYTGSDATLGHTSTDAKLDQGGQGIHLLHTDTGDYRVEAPVNTGASILAAMATPTYQTAPTIHNKWFLDKVQPNTNVLFASHCAAPNKKHPNQAVRCTFWFPDPDSDSHEYMTLGDFTPYLVGDGANTARVANVLCGTGKLNPETEAKLCGPPPATVTPQAALPSTGHPAN